MEILTAPLPVGGEMKHYFCLLKPARLNMHETVTEEEKGIFADHSEYLQKKYEEKVVLQAGTSFEKNQDHFAIVILRAKDKDEAVATIEGDPAVAKGLLKARVTEYSIFLDRAL